MNVISKKSLLFLFLLASSIGVKSQVSFTADKTSGCNPISVTFTNTTPNIDAYTYVWNMSDNQNSKLKKEASATYDTPGEKQITLTALDADGKEVGRSTMKIIVYQNPVVTISSSKDETCKGNSLTFEPVIVSSDTVITSYNWDFGDGNSSSQYHTNEEKPTYTFNDVRDSVIMLLVTDAHGCTNGKMVARKRVKISTSVPKAAFSFPDNKTYSCDESVTLTLTDGSSFAGGTITRYEWSFGNGETSTDQNPTVTFTRGTTTKSIYVQEKVFGSNGCYAEVTRYFTMSNLQPIIHIYDAEYTGKEIQNSKDSMACPGHKIRFEAIGTGITKSAWDFNNDGVTDTTVNSKTITWNPPLAVSGEQTIRLTATDASKCTASTTATYKVEPEMNINIKPRNVFKCQSPYYDFLRLEALNVTPERVFWKVNSVAFDTSKVGLTQSRKAYVFAADKTYDIEAKVKSVNGCEATKTEVKTVRVYVPMISWNLKVLDQPESPSQQGCVPLVAKIIDKSTYNVPEKEDSINSMTLSFGDNTAAYKGKVRDSILHTYTKTGIYVPMITYTTLKGCTYVSSKQVEVGDSLQEVSFSLSNDTVCQNTGVAVQKFNKNSLKIDSVYISFNAKAQGHEGFENKNSSPHEVKDEHDVESLSFTFKRKADTKGWYDMRLKSYYNGCPQRIVDSSKAVFVNGPWVYTNQVAGSCQTPFEKTLTIDTIRDFTSSMWKIYKMISPVESKYDTTYNNPLKLTKRVYADTCRGKYNAWLIAVDSVSGCRDSSVEDFTITNTKMAFTVTDTTPCFYDRVLVNLDSLKDKDLISTVSWTVKDPDGQSSVRSFRSVYMNDTMILKKRGIHLVKMTATDVNSCVSDHTDTIQVYGPVARFNMTDVKTCLPTTIGFKDSSSSARPIVERRWQTNGKTGSFLTGNKTNVFDEYNKKMTFSVRYVVEDELGCVDTLNKPNSVIPFVPAARIILNDNKVCVGTPALFQANLKMGSPFVNKIDSMRWEFGKDTIVRRKGTEDTASYVSYKELSNEYTFLTTYAKAPNGDMCMNKDSTNLLDVKNTSAANISLLNDKLTCETATISLNASSSKNYNTLTWFEIFKDASGQDSTTFKGQDARVNFIITKAGVHKLRLVTTSSYKGCENDADTLEYFIPKPKAVIVTDRNEVCVNDTIHFTLKDTANLARFYHKWTYEGLSDEKSYKIDHAFEKVFENGEAKVFFYMETTLKNGIPCSDATSAIIKVRSIMADFDRGNDDKIVEGCVPFEVPFIDKSVGASTQVWDFGDGKTEQSSSTKHTFHTPGITYHVKLSVVGKDGGVECKDDQVKTIVTTPNPELSHNVGAPACKDSVLTVVLSPKAGTVITSWDNESSIQLNGNKTVAVIKADTTKKYIIHSSYAGTNGVTCLAKDTILVRVQQRPAYRGAPKNYLVRLPDDTLVSKPKDKLYTYVDYSLNNDSLSGVTYRWEPSEGLSCTKCADPNIKLTRDMIYTVTMTDSLGCFTIAEKVDLKVILESLIGMPTAFTPNADGSNDLAIPRGWGVKQFVELRIYNRWGQVVFVTNEKDKGWDGVYNGRPADPDTFGWTITYIDNDDKEQFKKGYITLLR